ncbi:MAG: hypothetical protein Kow00107_03820 [Planctomycetota bacterium]
MLKLEKLAKHPCATVRDVIIQSCFPMETASILCVHKWLFCAPIRSPDLGTKLALVAYSRRKALERERESDSSGAKSNENT